MSSESKCPRKEECGSCSWSHIPYEKQLAQKLSDINGSFALKELDLRCDQIFPSPVIEHYRNRMDFVISFKGELGLRQKGKWWRVIDGHTCFISDLKIEHHFKTIQSWLQSADLSFYDRKAHTGLLRYAVIRSSSIGETLINVVTSNPKEEKQRCLEELNKLAELSGATTLIWAINNTDSDVSSGEELHTISGKGYLEEEINGYRYKISPQAFFQTNSSAAGLLIDTAKEFVGDLNSKVLLDLYCGSGFFSIAMSDIAQKTYGVELDQQMIIDAQENAKRNNVDVEYTSSATESFNWTIYNPNVVILDPPRSGLHKNALKDVLNYKPEQILYVSCNFKNFAREMLELKEYYHVEQMRAVDLFPHTPHVELISLLSKKS
ncbi:MAG: 23S rRNA (uracil(1939)-C(5))-methyltransferase RlmD [Deltaproteobacteria bacterium]|nr:23S rRNA (uracil(1939)-C(5))-methyltransferase RlmD [Deltaproteobacteria bacterium]